jgi:hypothetical protein
MVSDSGNGAGSLIEVLRSEARRRGFDVDELDAPTAFRLVRDMPYRRAHDRLPRTTIREWRGTCSGKHYLLKSVFEELGLASRLMASTHYIPDEVIASLPASIREVTGGKPVADVHTYLVADSPAGPMIVDATWPLGSERLGLVVNQEFVWGEDMRLACNPMRTLEVPAGTNAEQFKHDVLRASFTPEELDVRTRFFALVAR